MHSFRGLQMLSQPGHWDESLLGGIREFLVKEQATVHERKKEGLKGALPFRALVPGRLSIPVTKRT